MFLLYNEKQQIFPLFWRLFLAKNSKKSIFTALTPSSSALLLLLSQILTDFDPLLLHQWLNFNPVCGFFFDHSPFENCLQVSDWIKIWRVFRPRIHNFNTMTFKPLCYHFNHGTCCSDMLETAQIITKLLWDHWKK